MMVCFSHGKESGPWGTKIKRLAEIAKSCGCDVESIDYRNIQDPDARAEKLACYLRHSIEQQDDVILVGSSMGGYVSILASETYPVFGVFLLAPALYIPGPYKQNYNQQQQNMAIVHGWSDDVIPVENSIKFARESQCSLHVIDGDHRLIEALDTVGELFSQYLRHCLDQVLLREG